MFLLLGLPLAYFLLMGSGHEAWARFRVLLEPLMVVFAAVGLLSIYRAVRGDLAIPIREGTGPKPGIEDGGRF